MNTCTILTQDSQIIPFLKFKCLSEDVLLEKNYHDTSVFMCLVDF